jgi:hypothetical protein
VSPSPPDEIPLEGAVGAVRVGDTVRKVTGPWTPTVHALLRYLADAGFDLAPEPLGLDELGREVQSFLPGTPAYRPWPPVLLRVDGVVRLARALRRYHDVVRRYDPGPAARWRAGDRPLRPGEVVCHGDFGAWNTLWQGDELVGVVDWDMAEPDPPIVDVAFLAVHAVPLRSDVKAREAGFAGPIPRGERLGVLCEAYGGVEPAEVLEAAAAFHVRDRQRTIEWGADGREPWATFLSRGELATIDDDAAWLREHGPPLIRSS